MASSQNGWAVDYSGAGQDRAPLIRDVYVPNGVRAGDVATIFRWLAEQYDRRVERLRPGWCWGWHVKVIEGSSVISNHASGTAVDFNAPDNPMRTGSTEKSLTAEQIAECHALERESGNVLRWGGDFSRDDPMHWEIIGTSTEVAALARRIRAEDQENDVDSDDAKVIIREFRNTRETLSDTQVLIIGAEVARRLSPQLTRIEKALGLELAEVAPTADENAAAVVKALAADGSDEETANALRIVLGDRAAAVGRLLAGIAE